MALLAPVFGGSIFGNLALLALGIGIQVATAILFPQKVKGPRQENLKAQTAKYGDHIARVHGTARVAGAVIWLKGDQVDEHKKKKQAGVGKSLGPETTTFSYTADFATAFAFNGPFEAVTRIWADDKLVYDNGALDFSDIVQKKKKAKKALKNASITIYLGTQDQEPDPDIEADRGAGSVPAWPGVCYTVWTGFPLDSFGVRLPNMEAEVVQFASTDTYTALMDDVENGNLINFPYDYDTYDDYIVGVYGDKLYIDSMPSGAHLSTSTLPFGSADNVHITNRLEVIVPTDPADVLHIFDLASGALLETVDWPGASAFLSIFQPSDSITIGGTEYYFVYSYGQLGMFSNDGSGWQWLQNISYGHVFNPVLNLSVGPDYIYGFWGSAGGGIRLVPWSPGGGMGAYFDPGVSFSGTQTALYYDETSDNVVLIATGGVYLFNNDMSSQLASNLTIGTSGGGPNASKRLALTDSTFIVKDAAIVYEVNFSDMSIANTWNGAAQNWDDANNLQLFYYMVNPNWNALIPMCWYPVPGLKIWFLPMSGPGRISLAELVRAECDLVELDNDTTQLTGTVYGYAVRDGSPPRGVIEDLMRVKFFDFAHIDGITVFFMRKTTSVRTLLLDYLGHAEKDPKPIHVTEEYSDLKELPERVALSYQSFEGDYRKGTQSVAAPASMDETKNTLQYETNLIMGDDEAAQSADIMFNESREVANIYRASVPPRFMELYPGEVVSIALDSNRSINAVLTKMEGETIFDMEFRKRSSNYSSTAVGIPTPPNEDSLLDVGRSGMVFIDGHLMLASNAEDGSFYLGVYLAEIGDFASTTIYRSTNGGLDFLPWVGLTDAVLHGYTDTALVDVPHPDAWDRSEITFHVIDSDGVPNFPSSVTEDQLLQDDQLNAFAVKSGDEWEYIRAASVIDNGDGSYTLSSMLRGRMGTEFAISGHAGSDEIVYLDATVINRSPDADRTLERIYVATNLTGFDPDFSVTFTNYGKGLRPWAPVDILGERDGSDNLTITWNRRDRLGQEWPEAGAEDPPMSEATEAYKVFIYDSGTLLRTIDTTTQTASYSAADQTTDFGAPHAAIDVGIVQVSATYGNGVEQLETV